MRWALTPAGSRWSGPNAPTRWSTSLSHPTGLTRPGSNAGTANFRASERITVGTLQDAASLGVSATTKSTWPPSVKQADTKGHSAKTRAARAPSATISTPSGVGDFDAGLRGGELLRISRRSRPAISESRTPMPRKNHRKNSTRFPARMNDARPSTSRHPARYGAARSIRRARWNRWRSLARRDRMSSIATSPNSSTPKPVRCARRSAQARVIDTCVPGAGGTFPTTPDPNPSRSLRIKS